MTGCEWCGVGPEDECVPECPGGPPIPPPKRGMRFRPAGPMKCGIRRRGGVDETTTVAIVTAVRGGRYYWRWVFPDDVGIGPGSWYAEIEPDPRFPGLRPGWVGSVAEIVTTNG